MDFADAKYLVRVCADFFGLTAKAFRFPDTSPPEYGVLVTADGSRRVLTSVADAQALLLVDEVETEAE